MSRILGMLRAIRNAVWGSGLLKFLLRRAVISIPVLFAIVFASFMLIRAVPGGPFDFSAGKPLPAEIRAALIVRYGLDRPLLLNFPGDGAVPDSDKPLVVQYPALPDCDQLEAGIVSEGRPQPVVDTYEGWYLFRLVQERRDVRILIDGKLTRCLRSTTVLYSDLFRSQFFEYVNNAVRLDFGLSLNDQTRGRLVTELISERLPASVRLGLLVITVGFIVGIPLGVLIALRRNTWIDYTVTFGATILDAIPILVLGPILIRLFVVQFKVFPGPTPLAWRTDNIFDPEFISRAILPVSALGLALAAGLARFTRTSLLQVLRDDYIRTARSKGMRERGVIYIHALKNSLIPVVTLLGPMLAGVVTGSLITERIFAIPGIGDVYVVSALARDYNMLVGVTIMYAVFLILGNIMVDVMYTWLDPRIRFD
jgi:ABC-type dipeptide/oligopeptide/nickel transport system permease component